MVLKIYILVWALGATTAGIIYLTGNMTPLLEVLFGLLTFSTLFLGFLSVVPSVIFRAPTEH